MYPSRGMFGGIDPIALVAGIGTLFGGKKESAGDKLINLRRKFIKDLFEKGGAAGLFPIHARAMSDIMGDYLLSRAAASRPILGRGGKALTEAYAAGSEARRAAMGRLPYTTGVANLGPYGNAIISGSRLAGSALGTSAFNDALVRAILQAEELARAREDALLQRSTALTTMLRNYSDLFR